MASFTSLFAISSYDPAVHRTRRRIDYEVSTKIYFVWPIKDYWFIGHRPLVILFFQSSNPSTELWWYVVMVYSNYSRTSGSGHPINWGTFLIRPVDPRPISANFNVNNLIKMATSLIRSLLDSPKGDLINIMRFYCIMIVIRVLLYTSYVNQLHSMLSKSFIFITIIHFFKKKLLHLNCFLLWVMWLISCIQ